MSIMYCEKHDRRWDSDKLEDCQRCGDVPTHSAEEDYRHFLSYSNLEHSDALRLAYFHGANADASLPESLLLPGLKEAQKIIGNGSARADWFAIEGRITAIDPTAGTYPATPAPAAPAEGPTPRTDKVRDKWLREVHAGLGDLPQLQRTTIAATFWMMAETAARYERAATVSATTELPQDWQDIFLEYRTDARTDAWLYQKIQAHAARSTSGAMVPATLLQEACNIALAISGHDSPDHPVLDPWRVNHEKRLRELETVACSATQERT